MQTANMRRETYDIHCRECHRPMVTVTVERPDTQEGDRDSRTLTQLHRNVRCIYCFDAQRSGQEPEEHEAVNQDERKPVYSEAPEETATKPSRPYTREKLVLAALEWHQRHGHLPSVEEWDPANKANTNNRPTRSAAARRVSNYYSPCHTTGESHWPGCRAVFANWSSWEEFIKAAHAAQVATAAKRPTAS